MVTAVLSGMQNKDDKVWLVREGMIKAGLTETLDGIWVKNVLDVMMNRRLNSNWPAMEKLLPKVRGSGMYVGPLLKVMKRGQVNP